MEDTVILTENTYIVDWQMHPETKTTDTKPEK